MTERDHLSRDLSQPDTRPAPLASPDCDLRGLEWMPLDAANLLDSTLFLKSTGDEFKAAMALICKSWRQVPAGSLPNDDDQLAVLSLARDWTSVRTMALRKWVLCSDGRLYHPIVAAKAMEALPMRQEFVEKKSADAERKARERQDRKDLFAKLKAAGITPKWDTKTGELRQLVAQLGQAASPVPPAPPASPTKAGESRNLSQDQSRDTSRLGQGPDTTPQGHSLENPSGSVGGAPAAPAPTPPAPPAPTPAPPPKAGKKRRGDASDPAPDEPLEGPKQRSSRPFRKCPDTFRLTGAMVKWANDEYPILDVDEIRKATRAFLNHRFATARIEWVPTWENWIKEEADRKASRARPGTGFQTARTPRQDRVAQHFSAAAERPIHRGPPPRPVTTVPQGEIEDVEPRPNQTAIGR